MNKVIKTIAVVVPIGALTISATAYVILSQQNNHFVNSGNDNSTETYTLPTPGIDKGNLHSTLSTKYLYDSIRIKNGYAEITDEMIAKSLSKLIHEAHFINYDGVKYNYEIINAQEVVFTISWPEDGYYHTRNYRTNITKDI